jgi:Tfp pilus assembly protein PilF
VQLVKVSDGYHLWSETYDRTLDDIFAVQDDIAQSVVKELRTALLGGEADSDASGQAKAEVAKAVKGRGTDPEAHRLYLLARHLSDRRTQEDTAKAIGYLKEALALEPKFALAWAELGGLYSGEADIGWAPVAEGYGRAREAVQRALALDSDLAEGHLEMACIQLVYDWDWRGAEASTRRALELAPGNAQILNLGGALARYQGRVEEAIGFYSRAIERDPLRAASFHNLGFALYQSDRFTEAEAAHHRALELSPQRTVSRALLSLTLAAQGRGEEAVAEAIREPYDPFRLWALAIIHDGLGHGTESDEALRDLTEKHAVDSAVQIAHAHAARGETDAAFEWLERAYAQRDSGLAEMRSYRVFRSLRGDPRWGAFLKKMGFEK